MRTVKRRTVVVAAAAQVVLMARGGAGQGCPWRESRWTSEFGGDEMDFDMWGGFGSGCEKLRCDGATESLWTMVRSERDDITRNKQIKAHEKTERSYCMVLAPDGRFAAHARGQYSQRLEQFNFREKEFDYEEEVGPRDNATGLLIASSEYASTYAACLSECGVTCGDLESENATFSLLKAAFLDGATPDTADGVCFDRRKYQTSQMNTVAFWVYTAVLIVLCLVPYYLACAISNPCCPGFATLNTLRNEFDDRCPCLSGWLRGCASAFYCRCLRCKRSPGSADTGTTQREGVVTDEEEDALDDETEHVVTSQPGDVELSGLNAKVGPDDGAVGSSSRFDHQGAANKPASGSRQFRLLMWQIFTMKKRDYSGIAKQVLYPATVFVAIWLIYIMMGVTGLGNRWNKSNPNFKRKDGETRDYQRGQILSYGLLESFAAQLAFISIMQYVIVGLVVDHHAKLLEATRMAGLRDLSYWAAHFVADGVVMGFFAALLIAIVASPGLFRSAGFADFPFGLVLALHWVYIVALVAFSFAATVVLPSATVASLFSVVVQIAVVVIFFLMVPDKDNKRGALPAVSPKVQRLWCLIPQFAYQLAIYGFQSNRVRFCRLEAHIFSGAESFVGQKYECNYEDDDDFIDWRDATKKALRELDAFLASYGAACSENADADDDGFGDDDDASLLAACSVQGPWSEFPNWFDQDTARMSQGYLGSLFGMLFIDIFLYLALAWYLNQVIPWSEYGTPRKFYFLCLPSYWLECVRGSAAASSQRLSLPPSRTEEDDDPQHQGQDDAVEPRPATDEIAVEIAGLRKTFGHFKAVDGVGFTVAKSEIFCLLGHNGAGKTTTIACLTGLLTPDRAAGTNANVLGYDILSADGMNHLRATLGVCPQHDILFPKLTLKEHIIFFARLKGKSPQSAARDADNLLKVFHLADRAAHLGSELSGGQRRKLSTSIALAGSSRFVVLDEPTAGMDPVARRELWTLLRTVRAGRSLLLTTHHMDEAEVLGDRTAIMVAGKIRANGTLPFLKRRFSPFAIAERVHDQHADAYRLEVELGPEGNAVDVDDLVLGTPSDRDKNKDVPPFAARASDDVTLTTVSSSSGGVDDDAHVLNYNVVLSSDDDMRRLAAVCRTLDDTAPEAVARYGVNTTTLEDVFLVVGKSAEIHNAAKADHGDAVVNLLKARSSSLDLEKGPASEHAAGVKPAQQRKTFTAVVKQTVAVLKLRAVQNIRSVQALAVVFTPAIAAAIVVSLAKDGRLDKNEHWSELANVTVALCIVGAFLVVPGLLAMPLVAERQLRLRNLLTISGCDARAFWLGTFISDFGLVLAPCLATLLVLLIAGMSYRRRHRTVEYDWDALNMNPIWLNASALVDSEFGGSEDFALRYLCEEYDDDVFCGEKQKTYTRRLWAIHEPWLWALFPVFALALPAFSHIMSYGFQEPMVCVGGFPLINLIGFIIGPLMFIIFFALVFGGTLNGTDPIKLVTWNFNEIISAFGWLAATLSPIGNVFAFLLRASGLSFIPRASQNKEESPTWPPYWACLVLLAIQTVVFETLTYVKDRIDTRPLAYKKSKFSSKRQADLDVDVKAERDRVLALLDTDEYLGHDGAEDDDRQGKNDESRFAVVRAAKFAAKFAADAKVALSYALPEEDHPPKFNDQVGTTAPVPGVAALELRKIYPPRRFGARAVEAVQNVTFAVAPGECFGLLGSNGAGKTTTMSMITRVLEPTSGDAKVTGVSTLTDFARASIHLSVVNQMNTLWEHLSCYAHVALFTRLRLSCLVRDSDAPGDGPASVDELVRATLAAVELDKHASKLAGRLSGGMKRKLCCACALVADPRVVLLDEPSAGLDPVSQRNLWNLLQKTMSGRSVVLTTHSLLEADVLCQRIGIMCFGQLRCLGTPAHLKARYTSGYDLVLRLDEARVGPGLGSAGKFEAAKARIEPFIQQAFSDRDQPPRLVATDAGTLTYELGGGGGPEALRGLLARAFESLDSETRADLGIASFVVNPASMEKVFLNIVADSENAHEEALKNAALGRQVATELDERDDALDVEFKEPVCCGCSQYAHRIFCRYNCAMCCGCTIYFVLGLFAEIVPWFVPAMYLTIIALFTCVTNFISVNMCFQRNNDDS